mmetsp:Transcript_54142/g.97204  ORF Transcript_54142/g.97204 Transcript_54142/m.97204 type:complete len:86 (+) Transcript_54142:332-589(+)
MTDLVIIAMVAALCSIDVAAVQNNAHALHHVIARNVCASVATVTADCAKTAIRLAKIFFGLDSTAATLSPAGVAIAAAVAAGFTK